jgi:heat-inducible transcriptional repressor
VLYRAGRYHPGAALAFPGDGHGGHSLTMLDERKAAILRAVVEEYIKTAQPVGSSHIAPAVSVSSATVRNEMAVLENDGYLLQPHTSAGRIPTDKGYRYFVDRLTGPGTLGEAQTQQVRYFFDSASNELERMLADTSKLLANLTQYAAVVVGPQAEAAVVRSFQLVGLTPRVALAVVVLSNGAVERRTLELPEDIGEERLAAVSAHVAANLLGRSLGDHGWELPTTGDGTTDEVAGEAVRALFADDDSEPDNVFVGGAARMTAAFDAVDTVRRVLGILEQQYVVVTVLRDVLDRGLQVAIGAETGLEPLSSCSLVVAPYEVDGEPAGTIGVLGPTRMDYPQALAAVALVSQRLGRRLTEG